LRRQKAWFLAAGLVVMRLRRVNGAEPGCYSAAKKRGFWRRRYLAVG
jgi:hypothetical protein